MSKTLVAYFLASGIIAELASRLSSIIGVDLFEIQPEMPYTKVDLNWNNPKSSSTVGEIC